MGAPLQGKGLILPNFPRRGVPRGEIPFGKGSAMALTPLPANANERALGAQALRRIADYLDALDNGDDVKIERHLHSVAMVHELEAAWRLAAVIIADQSEITTGVIRQLANRLSQGVQDAFEF